MWDDIGVTTTNNAWAPPEDEFDFSSVFGASNNVWSPTADNSANDAHPDNNMNNSGMTTTPMSSMEQPSNGDVKHPESYFGNIFGNDFDSKINKADNI